MKTKNIPLYLVAAIALSSCQTTDTARTDGIDYGELASELSKPNVRFSKAKVTCRIVSADKTESLPSMVIRRGRSASSKTQSEGIYPIAFDFPEFPKLKTGFDGFPVSPTNPTAFDTTELGWTLQLKADARDGFIMLAGTLTDRRMGSKVRAGGVPFQPITAQASDAIGRDVTVVLSENIAARPSIVTEEIPILIAAKSGGTYRIYLDEEQTRYAEITCSSE